MRNRKLDEDTKVYNLYQKYLKFKTGKTVIRVLNHQIYNKSDSINVKEVEKRLKYKDNKNILKKKISEKLKEEAKKIQQCKNIYGEFYTDDKVNIQTLADNTFKNIIENGNDKILDFSINYDFTKAQFGITQNTLIFEIQDGMYDFLTKDNNIKLIDEWIDESNLYDEVKNFCKKNTSRKYNTEQKKNKLINIKNEKLEDLNYSLSKNIDDKINALNEDINIINHSLDCIDDKEFNIPKRYKANLLLKKNIINITSLNTAIKIVKNTKLI